MVETTNAVAAIDDLKTTLMALREDNSELREQLAGEEHDAELLAAECKRLRTSKALGGGKFLREFREHHKAAFPAKRCGTPGLIRLCEKLLEAKAAGGFEEIEQNNDRITKLPGCLHPLAAVALLELLEAILGNVPTPRPNMAVPRP